MLVTIGALRIESTFHRIVCVQHHNKVLLSGFQGGNFTFCVCVKNLLSFLLLVKFT